MTDEKARMSILQGLPGFYYVVWLYQKNLVSNRVEDSATGYVILSRWYLA